jgi:predicted ATP-dependent protease
MGLTGSQGVIIPRQNLPNLILEPEVQKAIADREFHIYTATTIDEGMEILTGREAGQRDGKGAFPKDSINALVEARLREMAELVKEFGGD